MSGRVRLSRFFDSVFYGSLCADLLYVSREEPFETTRERVVEVGGEVFTFLDSTRGVRQTWEPGFAACLGAGACIAFGHGIALDLSAEAGALGLHGRTTPLLGGTAGLGVCSGGLRLKVEIGFAAGLGSPSHRRVSFGLAGGLAF